MSEIKLPFTQNVGIIIAAATIFIALFGYILYFQAQSRLSSEIKRAEDLKEKYSMSDKMLADMKTKYDNVYEDMKKMMDDLQNSKQKYQDCQTKLDSIETRYDTLNRLQGSQTTPSTSTNPDSQTAPAPTGNAPASPTAPASPNDATTTPPTITPP